MKRIFKLAVPVTFLAISCNVLAADTGASIPDGYFKLTTQFREGHGECLEGNQLNGSMNGAAFMDKCQNVSGQLWKAMPAGNGYFKFTTQFRERNGECLEGNQVNGSMNGVAFMDKCQNVSGQLWKATPAGNGYFKLTTQFREGNGECLEGNQVNGSMNGAAFMDKCQNVSGQLWKLDAERTSTSNGNAPSDGLVGENDRAQSEPDSRSDAAQGSPVMPPKFKLHTWSIHGKRDENTPYWMGYDEKRKQVIILQAKPSVEKRLLQLEIVDLGGSVLLKVITQGDSDAYLNVNAQNMVEIWSNGKELPPHSALFIVKPPVQTKAGSGFVSFESNVSRGHYLRHQSFDVKLSPLQKDEVFLGDATWLFQAAH